MKFETFLARSRTSVVQALAKYLLTKTAQLWLLLRFNLEMIREGFVVKTHTHTLSIKNIRLP